MALNAVCNERLQSKEKLLGNLVKTVCFLIDLGAVKQSLYAFWSGLNLLHTRVKTILRHGAKIRHHLIFAQPSFAAFDSWLESRLLDHSLAEEIGRLRPDICEFYYDWGFLHDQQLFNTFVHCLRILGTRDLDLLCDIQDLSSIMINSTSSSSLEYEGKCKCETKDKEEKESESLLSLPGMQPSSIAVAVTSLLPQMMTPEVSVINLTDKEDSSSSLSIPAFSYTDVSPICSPPNPSYMPCLDVDNVKSQESNNENDPTDVVFATPSSALLKSNFLDVISGGGDNITRTSSASISDTKSSPELPRKAVSFLESGGLIQPPALGNFPLPHEGQTLTSFLSSLSDTMPELDRENAHFNVSEALISAFERLRVNRTYKHVQVDGTGEKEDLFGTVKVMKESEMPSTSRICQEQASFQANRKYYANVANTVKKFPRPPILHTETEESEFEYWRQQPRKPPSHIRKKPRKKLGSDGRSDSIFSATELSTTNNSSLSSLEDNDIMSSSFSAENIAFSLLRNAKMTEELLPPASELQWLVTEKDAPQTLLPLPKNWTTSASESETDLLDKTDFVGKLDKSMRLRGTSDWAPPRPQIIFTVHPSPSFSVLTDIQRYRCAGCGMRVDPKYASTFRYCFYLGRYFCTGCHTGKKARLPQIILHKWDFSPYSISNFSAQLLESLYTDPVYNVLAINPNLTKKVKLNNFRNYRIQLGFLNEYLKNCKMAESLYVEYKKFPTYYTADVDLCSLEDLINVRFSTGLPVYVKDFVAQSIYHVLNCELCRNLGFVCEMCNRNETLFPFQINRVSRCPKCASCFHLKCFNSALSDCPKCLRVTKRRNTIEVPTASIAV